MYSTIWAFTNPPGPPDKVAAGCQAPKFGAPEGRPYSVAEEASVAVPAREPPSSATHNDPLGAPQYVAPWCHANRRRRGRLVRGRAMGACSRFRRWSRPLLCVSARVRVTLGAMVGVLIGRATELCAVAERRGRVVRGSRPFLDDPRRVGHREDGARARARRRRVGAGQPGCVDDARGAGRRAVSLALARDSPRRWVTTRSRNWSMPARSGFVCSKMSSRPSFAPLPSNP